MDWVAERYRTKTAAAEAESGLRALRASHRQRLLEQSPPLWKELAREIASSVERYNQLNKAPTRELSFLAAADDILLVSGIVIEPVPDLWFSAPQKITLQIWFDPVQCVVSYVVLGRPPGESLYIENSLAGSAALHLGANALSCEEATQHILSKLLDITDPLPSK